MRKGISGIIIILLLTSVLPFVHNIQPAKALGGTIYIRSDGSVDPPFAPIWNVGNVYYTFTANISDSIVVERNNIVVYGAGYVLEGGGAGNGISLIGISNVTIKGVTIRGFYAGIFLNGSSGNSLRANKLANNGLGIFLSSFSNSNNISSNTITNNSYGIYLNYSSVNSIFLNTIASNTYIGILLNYSPSNSVSANTITSNNYAGIYIGVSSNNIVSANTIANNGNGTFITSSSGNNITSNTITNNRGESIYLTFSSSNSISTNTITGNNGDGIYFSSSSGNSITANTITGNDGYNGIYFSASSGNGISANIITGNGWYGIWLHSSSNNSISKNTVTSNNHYGIELDIGSSNSISENTITNNGADGIYLYLCLNGNSVSRNTITGNGGDGIYTYSCSGDIISANTITNNKYGVYLDSSSGNSLFSNKLVNNTQFGLVLNYSPGNSIYENTVTNNPYGIYAVYFSNGSISANTITNNGEGIHFLYSSNISITSNTISNNQNYGIYLYQSSSNIICHNSFVDNPQQTYVTPGYANIWDDGYPSGGNYWSDYSGIDLYKGPNQNVPGTDGIGDTPDIIDVNNVDHYPLMSPWNPTLSIEGITAWYWTSNTTVNSVAVGDVDGNGQKETVTAGTFYDGTRNVAQLVVWNSSSLSPERLTTWFWTGNTTINSVAIGDVNGDGQNEIVTGGSYFDGTRQVAQLVVWNGSSLAAEQIKTWYWTGNTVINSLAIGDVDNDGQVEIVTGGYFNDGTRDIAQVVVWAGSGLSIDRLTTWFWTGNTIVNSVALGDVDGDGQVEIVTGGTFFDGTRSEAQLIVWTGSSLIVDRLTTWYVTGNTVIKSLAVGDVNNDGQTEIVTAGYFNDGARNEAQLEVWSGSSLTVDTLMVWYVTGNTVINSVAIGDVDGNGQPEIVTGGSYFDGARDVAQMIVWSGSSLAIENVRAWYWVSDTHVNSVCLSDINGDLSNEIVTGGAYNDGLRWIAQSIIWGMTQTV